MKPQNLVAAISYLLEPGNTLEETVLKQLYAKEHGGKTGHKFGQWKRDYNIISGRSDGESVYYNTTVTQLKNGNLSSNSSLKSNNTMKLKLKQFNPENTIAVRSGLPTINFVSGCMTLSPSACELLQVKDGDGIVFHQDENEPQDWYISKSNNGFKLRPKTGTACLCTNSVGIKQSIFKSVNCTKTTHTFLIGADAQLVGDRAKVFPIITSTAKNKS